MNLLDLFFPKNCLKCGSEGKYLCSICVKKVLDGTFDKNNFAIFKYKGIIRKAITTLKYKFATDIADELVEICIQRLNSSKFHNVVLVPVPLYKQRENWRGFNQSNLLGKKLSEKLNWKFVPDLLTRDKNTISQVGLKGSSRRSNLSGVFSVNSSYLDRYLSMSKLNPILIFDDVYTTGSTINEARKVLEVAGFKKIYSLTIAR